MILNKALIYLQRQTLTTEYESNSKTETFEMRCLRAISGVKLRRNRSMLIDSHMHTKGCFCMLLKAVDSCLARMYHLDFPNSNSEADRQRNGALKSERTHTYHLRCRTQNVSKKLRWMG